MGNKNVFTELMKVDAYELAYMVYLPKGNALTAGKKSGIL